MAVICQPLMEVIKTVRTQTAKYDRLLRGMPTFHISNERLTLGTVFENEREG